MHSPYSSAAAQQQLMESRRQSFERYAAGERHQLARLGVLLHGTGHHLAQLDHLALRAQKALHAAACVRQTEGSAAQALFIGRYLYSEGLAAHFAPRLRVLPLDFKAPPADEAGFAALCQQLRGHVVIVNNNDIGDLNFLQRLTLSCPDTLFVACLYDAHHSLELSCTISLCVDLVFPAHYDYLAVLNRYCPFVCGPLPASTLQWTRADMPRLEPLLYSTPRTVRLSGGFTHYPQFPFRNGIVQRVMQQPVGAALELPTGASAAHHSHRSADDNWRVWCSSKVNLMVPSMADLPHRFFDALLTGNVPLVPRWVAPFFDAFDFSAFQQPPFVWFDHADLADMSGVVARAEALFDSEGNAGIAQRHRWVRDQHLLDNRIEHILRHAQELLNGRAARAVHEQPALEIAA